MELRAKAKALEDAVELRNINIGGDRDFIKELFPTPEQRAQAYYRCDRYFDRRIEESLRAGRLRQDPRKDPQWQKDWSYTPPKVKSALAPALG